MSDVLAALRARWQESGAHADLVTYLRAWGEPPERGGDLELAARCGHPAARDALAEAPDGPADEAPLRLAAQVPAWTSGPAAFEARFGRWQPAFVYVRALLRAARAWWLERDPAYAESLTRLTPLAEALDAWFAAPDAERAAALEAWSRAGWSVAELVGGDHDPPADRALGHLVHAFAALAAAGWPEASLRAPLWGGTAAPPTAGLRFAAVHGALLETDQAIVGIAHARADAPGAPLPAGLAEESRAALARPAARALSDWLLRDL